MQNEVAFVVVLIVILFVSIYLLSHWSLSLKRVASTSTVISGYKKASLNMVCNVDGDEATGDVSGLPTDYIPQVCGNDLVCVANPGKTWGFCKKDIGEVCTSLYDCGPDAKMCALGLCITGAPGDFRSPCIGGTTCNTGMTCTGGLCLSNLGQSCSKSVGCVSDFCNPNTGVCETKRGPLASCFVRGMCQTGYECDTVNGYCQLKQTSGEPYFTGDQGSLCNYMGTTAYCDVDSTTCFHDRATSATTGRCVKQIGALDSVCTAATTTCYNHLSCYNGKCRFKVYNGYDQPLAPNADSATTNPCPPGWAIDFNVGAQYCAIQDTNSPAIVTGDCKNGLSVPGVVHLFRWKYNDRSGIWTRIDSALQQPGLGAHLSPSTVAGMFFMGYYPGAGNDYMDIYSGAGRKYRLRFVVDGVQTTAMTIKQIRLTNQYYVVWATFTSYLKYTTSGSNFVPVVKTDGTANSGTGTVLTTYDRLIAVPRSGGPSLGAGIALNTSFGSSFSATATLRDYYGPFFAGSASSMANTVTSFDGFDVDDRVFNSTFPLRFGIHYTSGSNTIFATDSVTSFPIVSGVPTLNSQYILAYRTVDTRGINADWMKFTYNASNLTSDPNWSKSYFYHLRGQKVVWAGSGSSTSFLNTQNYNIHGLEMIQSATENSTNPRIWYLVNGKSLSETITGPKSSGDEVYLKEYNSTHEIMIPGKILGAASYSGFNTDGTPKYMTPMTYSPVDNSVYVISFGCQ